MSDIELLRPLNHIGTNTIKTARLVLRRFQFSDHTDMFRWASDPDVVKYLSYAPHKTINETKTVLKSWIKNMTLEGTFRRYCYQKDGSIGDKFYYAILESDRH